MDRLKELVNVFPKCVKESAGIKNINFEEIREIRFRTGKPIILNMKNNDVFFSQTTGFARDIKEADIVYEKDMREMLEKIFNYSKYAFENEIKSGFVTLPGGHRVGILGQAVMENGDIKNFKNINYINLRIAHELKYVSDEIMEKILKNKNVCSTLIISPPGFGKTTLLRDIIRNLSYGRFGRAYSISVVDERDEIAAPYQGIAQNDLGPRTDVISNCNKKLAVDIVLRSMNPQVIALDEIGLSGDVTTLEKAFNCGPKIIATIHGDNLEDVKKKESMKEILKKGYFEKFIEIERNGRYKCI